MSIYTYVHNVSGTQISQMIHSREETSHDLLKFPLHFPFPPKIHPKIFLILHPTHQVTQDPFEMSLLFLPKKNQRGNSGRPGLYCKAWGLGGRQGPAVANQWLGATPPGL